MNKDTEGKCWKNGVITKKYCENSKRREGNLCY